MYCLYDRLRDLGSNRKLEYMSNQMQARPSGTIGALVIFILFITASAAFAGGPKITAISQVGINCTSVQISWSTDIQSDSFVEYGTTTAYGATTGNASYLINHSVQISGLEPITLYHYKVISKDLTGATSESADLILFLVQLSWDVPDWNVQSYLLGYGNYSQTYALPLIDVGTATTYTIAISNPGIYYFAVKAQLYPGMESEYSNERLLVIGDIGAFYIFDIKATDINANNALIIWKTEPVAVSKIKYGTSEAYDHETTIKPEYVNEHSELLTSLEGGIRYHYKIEAQDALGNNFESGDLTFTTPDITPPVISGIEVSDVGNIKTTISWSTNEESDSQVEYGITDFYGSESIIDLKLVSRHSIILTGLQYGTQYHFRIRSRDATANIAISEDFTFTTASPSATLHSVDNSNVLQRIDGFGATALFENSSWLNSLSDSQADMYFSDEFGVGLSLLRNIFPPDGSVGDSATLQAIQNRGAKIWNVPLSPPAIWKDNGDLIGGGHLLAEHYQDYANYLANYMADMKASGIISYAVSVQNEPDASGAYESCLWTGQQLHDFIPYLYNSLSVRGMNATKIMIAEDSNWRFELVTPSMNDTTVAGDVGILAAHDYGTRSLAPVNSSNKPIWNTGVSDSGAYDGSMTDAMKSAESIHWYMVTAQASAWHYLWLVPKNDDNSGLTDIYGNPAKRMYVIGNFSKFVRPGYFRINATSIDGVSVSAFKDPDSSKFAIVAINGNSTERLGTFSLLGLSPVTLTPWITSEDYSLEPQPSFAISGSSFTYFLPANSVVTFVPDTYPPIISGIVISSISDSDATITWTTNENSNSQVEYGITDSYGGSTYLNNSMVTSHSIGLSGLSPNTIYHFRVKSTDYAGDLSVSDDYTFTTVADTTPPFISAVSVSSVSDSGATITWITNEPSDSRVEYGSTTAYGNATLLNSTMLLSHRVDLSGLSSSNLYHYRLVSLDSSGNVAVSGDFTFSTFDTIPPVISGVAISDITESGARISWTTNEASDSEVQWRLSGYLTGSSGLDASLVTSHALVLTNLYAGNGYQVNVLSRDAAGNLATSDPYSFTTAASSGGSTHEIIWTDVRQQIDGFGASAYWLNSTGLPNLSDSQAAMFFSADTGIGLSLLRSIVTPDGTTTALGTMQKAQNAGARVWSVPLSPPAAWKDNGNVKNGGSLLAIRYPDYASQLAGYVAAMKVAGIHLAAISIQNEPDVSASYESSQWSAQQIHDFIPYLYSALASRGVSSTKILIPEDSNWRLDLASIALADPTSAGQVGIVAAHDNGNEPSALATAGKPLWQTETAGFEAFDGGIENAVKWAANIHRYLTIVEANAWQYKWLIPKDADNSGITDQNGNPAKRMYAIGNFSKFVRPGYYRIGATSANGILISAYKDPNSSKYVIVAINTNNTDTLSTFSLPGISRAFITPWVTSETLSLAPQTAITIYSSMFSYTLPATSVVTFVPDTTTPAINSISSSNITGSGATITWVTDEYADSQIEYGTTAAYDKSTTLDNALVKLHTVELRGLTINTIYHYRVRSRDAAGNLGLSGDRTFTTAALPVPSDFGGDTRSDILLRNPLTGEISVWFSNGSGFSSSLSLAIVPDLGWKIAGIGDFNGDGKPDILWRHYGLGENYIWFMNGTQYLQGSYIEAQRDLDYKIEGVGDLNGDGKADILWRRNIEGTYSVWFMDGFNHTSSANLEAPGDINWHLAGVGDFNGDGKNDLLWRNYATGENRIGLMNGTVRVASVALDAVTDVNWKIVGVGDYDGDGQVEVLWKHALTKENRIWHLNGAVKQEESVGQVGGLNSLVSDVGQAAIGPDFDNDGNADLVWQDAITGNNYVWLMNGVNYNGGTFLESMPANWRIVAAGDFDKNGTVDLVWHNDQTGENYLWFMNGLAHTGAVYLSSMTGTGWNVAGTGDLNGDGYTDLVWSNSLTGENRVWLMNGITHTGDVTLENKGNLSWKIVGAGDFNGDGKVDLLWSNPSTGESSIWFMNGTTRISEVSLERMADTNFKIATAGDFNRDGKIDIVWRNLTTGEDVVWFMDGAIHIGSGSLPTVPGQRWRIISLGD
jgi:O-glycosyl hydrolase